MRAAISGRSALSGSSGILIVGLIVVAGGCRTLRSHDAGWQALDQPARDCMLPTAGAPADAGIYTPGATQDELSISVYAAATELAERLAGAGLFGIDCAENAFAGHADSWQRGPEGALSFRGAVLDSAIWGEERLVGVDSVRWIRDALVVYGGDEAGTDLRAVYGSLVQPAPDVALRTTVNDERDLIDQGIDVLVTEDPTVTDYSNRSGEYRTVALPLTRLYVVVGPVGADMSGGIAMTLARGITADTPVIGDADLVVCNANSGDEPLRDAATQDLSGRVLFEDADSAARDLASRIVALSSQGGMTPDRRRELVATGVEQDGILEEQAIRDGDFLVLRVRVPAPGEQLDNRGCVALPDGLLDDLDGRPVIAVAWVQEHAILSSDALIVVDIDGLPVARRAKRGGR